MKLNKWEIVDPMIIRKYHLLFKQALKLHRLRSFADKINKFNANLNFYMTAILI